MSSNNNDDVPNETATQASLEAFFTRFTFPGYQYNSQAPPEEEFRRLLEARKWGERRAAFFHRQFLEAGTSSSPLVIIDRSTPTSLFFIAQQSSSTAGYEFQGRAPEVEFGDLVRKEAGQWRRFRNMLTEGSESRESREGERYKGTSEYEQLRRAFHAAVEQEFDWLLENQHGSEGERSMKPWEYLVVLFKVGQLPISKKKALKVSNYLQYHLTYPIFHPDCMDGNLIKTLRLLILPFGKASETAVYEYL